MLVPMPKPKSTTLAAFTLLELLVVIGIMGILVAIGFGSFTSSQVKARDARRKADLENIARALEMYRNDYKEYPDSISGKIKNPVSGAAINWGKQFVIGSVTYMSILPSDSRNGYHYQERDCGSPGNEGYRLFARLENLDDAAINRNAVTKKPQYITTTDATNPCVPTGSQVSATSCGGKKCNYVLQDTVEAGQTSFVLTDE